MNWLSGKWKLVLGAALLILLVAGCVRAAPLVLPRIASDRPGDGGAVPDASVPSVAVQAPAQPTSTTARSVAVGPQKVPVRVGTITQTESVFGKVVGSLESALSFSLRGRVDTVSVKNGQRVEQGQVLITTESTELTRQLESAQQKLQADVAAMKQAQAQVDRAQRAAAQRAQATQQQRAAAVAGARDALQKAQDNLARVRAGASNAERRQAEAAVIQAQAAAQKAHADLDRAQSGPDPAEVRAAQRALQAAQAQVAQTQEDFNTLVNGDPLQLETAQREVQRAQSAVATAQSAPVDPRGGDSARAAHDAAVSDAQFSLQAAQDKLTRLKAGPSPATVAAARQKVEAAQDAVQAAQDKFDAIQQGPDRQTLESSQQAADHADGVLSDAQAALAALNARPSGAELRDAENQVRQAQAALDQAQNSVATSDADSSAPDLDALEQTLQQDQAQIDSLRSQLDSTRLVAPFAGTVTNIQVKAGDAVDTGKVVLTLTRPGDLLVRVQLTADEAQQVSVGQRAVVRPDQAPPDSQPLQATVTTIGKADKGTGKVANLQVNWSGDPPSLGSAAQVDLVLQQKDGVLLIPAKALRSTGTKTYVEYYDGGTRRIGDVEVGIKTAAEVEITRGLSEGQLVVVGL